MKVEVAPAVVDDRAIIIPQQRRGKSKRLGAFKGFNNRGDAHRFMQNIKTI